MSDLILTTYDWVPEPPRGFVRDLRVRWALEEAGLPYRVESTSFENRGPAHLAAQPFGQVPWLTDGELTLFESGAILLHLGGKSLALMPAEPKGRAEVQEWVIAALNSVEMSSQPWALFRFMGFSGQGPEAEFVNSFIKLRLERLEAVLASREWLANGAFSIADILMADVLRPVDMFDGLASCPACAAYLGRAKARPAFKKAYEDQMAHFAMADTSRGALGG
jgi:glutathione S-transferase